MKPWETLGDTRTPDGVTVTLARRDTEYVLLADGHLLMTSRMHASEEALAVVACDALAHHEAPRVLIGGLGMGFTVRAALDRLPASAAVVVAELLPAVVAWNEGPLAPLADAPLRDPRVTVDVRDVSAVLRDGEAAYDAVLLDVDNGADAFTSPRNQALYGRAGLASLRAALRPGGLLAVWSATRDPRFTRHLRAAGFDVETRPVRARPGGRGPRHVVVLGRRRGDGGL